MAWLHWFTVVSWNLGVGGGHLPNTRLQPKLMRCFVSSFLACCPHPAAQRFSARVAHSPIGLRYAGTLLANFQHSLNFTRSSLQSHRQTFSRYLRDSDNEKLTIFCSGLVIWSKRGISNLCMLQPTFL